VFAVGFIGNCIDWVFISLSKFRSVEPGWDHDFASGMVRPPSCSKLYKLLHAKPLVVVP
jgi:hypothetical protein